MNNLTQDFIAIDTNVFMHLFNSKMNTNDHIWNLINRLHEDEIGLLIDAPKKDDGQKKDDSPKEEIQIIEEYKGSRIIGEYRKFFFPDASHVKEQNSPRQGGGAEPREEGAAPREKGAVPEEEGEEPREEGEEPREEGAERVLLRNFFENTKLVEVEVNQTDNLMVSIKGIIEVREGKPVTDRFFVYVAFRKDRVLVTNDSCDILNNKEELKHKAKKLRLRGADILSSQEAYEKIRIADSSSTRGEPNHE